MADAPLEAVRLESARVVVRSTETADAARVAHYFARNRAHLEPWEPAHEDAFYTQAFWETTLRDQEEARRRGMMLRMLFFEKPDEDTPAGMISLVNVMARAPVWQGRVGYSLDETKQGRGLMGEALELVVRHAFDVLNLKRVVAGHLPHNVRSSRVLTRAGFVREAYQREFFYVGGRWEDHVETYRLNPNWKAPR